MFFDMTGRAKWDAWNDLGKTLEDETDPVQTAEELYLQHARNLGWPESQEAINPSTVLSETQKGATRGGGGMGTSVSVPVVPDEASVEDSIHGYAVKGDLEKLQALLDDQPGLVNSRDEFVSAIVHDSKFTLTPNRNIHPFILRQTADIWM
jgi:hypothetical protein